MLIASGGFRYSPRCSGAVAVLKWWSWRDLNWLVICLNFISLADSGLWFLLHWLLQ